MKSFKIISSLVLLLFCVASARAQEQPKNNAKEIPDIEVLDCYKCNDLVISLPDPVYPAYVGYGPHLYNGDVSVAILIDEEGKVETAKGISGHLYFRPMLEKESLKARFKPATVNGEPTKRKAVISYRIVSRATSAGEKLVVKRKPVTKIISCGICNQKAIFLPKPEFPHAATFVNASGRVSVQILIDENGNVESAKAISGHIFLRPAAIEAALKARFEPFSLASGRVRVLGLLVYNFTR